MIWWPPGVASEGRMSRRRSHPDLNSELHTEDRRRRCLSRPGWEWGRHTTSFPVGSCPEQEAAIWRSSEPREAIGVGALPKSCLTFILLGLQLHTLINYQDWWSLIFLSFFFFFTHNQEQHNCYSSAPPMPFWCNFIRIIWYLIPNEDLWNSFSRIYICFHMNTYNDWYTILRWPLL